MTKSYFYLTNPAQHRAEVCLEGFLNRFEGMEIARRSPEAKDDGVRIYEIPPEIYVIKRPTISLNNNQVIRYDLLGGTLSSDGRDRAKALAEEFSKALKFR